MSSEDDLAAITKALLDNAVELQKLVAQLSNTIPPVGSINPPDDQDSSGDIDPDTGER